MNRINTQALVADSQDWRGRDGAEGYRNTLGWVTALIRQGKTVNLGELYSSRMSQEWGGEAPTDLDLYRTFLHLSETGVGIGENIPYTEKSSNSHSDTTLSPGPEVSKTRWIVTMIDTGKDLFAKTSSEYDPEAAAMECLMDLEDKESLASKTYNGPKPSTAAHFDVQDVDTGRRVSRFTLPELVETLTIAQYTRDAGMDI